MELSLEMWLQLGVLLVAIAIGFANVKNGLNYTNQKIDRLEKKQDQHNSLIERMVVVEQVTESAHKRIDEIYFKIDRNKKKE